jgi:hypothetical protein
MTDIEKLQQERDEARAEVAALKAKIAERNDFLLKLYDAACPGWTFASNPPEAMVANVTASLEWHRQQAFEHGAKKMQKAAAEAMHPVIRSMVSRTEAAETILALPIPNRK